MFYAMLCRLPSNQWSVSLPEVDPIELQRELKVKKAKGMTATIVKVDDINGLEKAINMMNRNTNALPKKGVLDFTRDGITAALLKTTS